MKSDAMKKIWIAFAVMCIAVIALCAAAVIAVGHRDTRFEGSITTYPDETPMAEIPVERVESAPAWTSENYDESATAIPNQVVLSEDEEMRAVWIPYMSVEGITPEIIDRMVADCRSIGANAIIFHVRPFADAVYDSLYFPWSHLVTGTQGIAPADGFDPLAYIIDKAHENGMQLHAWVNPLRIQLSGGRLPSDLSADNFYTKWRSDENPHNDNWVIDYEGGKYYNPAVEDVRNLIVNGMAELAANYKVDGVHWDDYFYPAYDESFDDSAHYQSYLNSGGTLSLRQWRTENINTLVRDVYNKVKATNSNCVFGISPAGNIQNCLAAGADVYEWCSVSGYIDYICPQVYWTFDSTAAPFAERTAEWKAMVKCDGIDFYVGLALYKAGSDADGGKWMRSDSIIADQIEYIRSDEINADGFMIYSYEYITGERTAAEMENVKNLLLG